MVGRLCDAAGHHLGHDPTQLRRGQAGPNDRAMDRALQFPELRAASDRRGRDRPGHRAVSGRIPGEEDRAPSSDGRVGRGTHGRTATACMISLSLYLKKYNDGIKAESTPCRPHCRHMPAGVTWIAACGGGWIVVGRREWMVVGWTVGMSYRRAWLLVDALEPDIPLSRRQDPRQHRRRRQPHRLRRIRGH